MKALVEFGRRIGSTVSLQPGERRVPHDRQDPRSRIAAAKTAGKSERAQIRVLHDILGIVIVAHQPSREVIRSIHMRQKYTVEIDAFV